MSALVMQCTVCGWTTTDDAALADHLQDVVTVHLAKLARDFALEKRGADEA